MLSVVLSVGHSVKFKLWVNHGTNSAIFRILFKQSTKTVKMNEDYGLIMGRVNS